MKTSNKLLLGLFSVVLISILTVNLLLKKEITDNPLRNQEVFIQSTTTVDMEQDSLNIDNNNDF